MIQIYEKNANILIKILELYIMQSNFNLDENKKFDRNAR